MGISIRIGRREGVFGVLVALTVVMLLGLAGCGSESIEADSVEAIAAVEACGECHEENVIAMISGPHGRLECVGCHEGADGEHADDPEAVSAAIDWRIDGCSGCHEYEAATYLYDDNLQVGPFGGSQRVPPQPKADTFPYYSEVVAGHPFANDYNEEGAHAYMLQDHYETTRGKFETCVQCKSTKVAYAWMTGEPVEVVEDVDITLTHTQTETRTAEVVTIPAGTKVSWASDPVDYKTYATAELPDGTVYTSYEPTGTGTKDFNMMWAATIAATYETMPYGIGCNHCHDPHSASPRIVRQALERAIEQNGINPYMEGSATSFDEARLRDQRNTLCSQCHVEYVCGKSGVDGIDRDYFSWSKAGDLHELYSATFEYQQDWVQRTIQQPLIKSQHPETELNWNSDHYAVGTSCIDCHMPEVRTLGGAGERFRSHWLTSPYKYQDPEVFAAFAKATGLRTEAARPCERCHGDRTADAMAIQQKVYERQKIVEELLAQSSVLLGEVDALKKAGGKVDKDVYDGALAAHRKAHVVWENLIVSENSMGFHNPSEVMDELAAAEVEVRAAIDASKKMLAGQ